MHGSGVGIVLQTEGVVDMEYAIRLKKGMTNNEAEYEAVIRGLELAHLLGAQEIVLHTDSMLVAQQIAGEFEAKDPRMERYLERVKVLEAKFLTIRILKIPREENGRADYLAKIAGMAEPAPERKIIVLNGEGEDCEAVMNINEVSDWRRPIIRHLETGERLSRSEEKKAQSYCLLGGALYKRSFSIPLLKCLIKSEGLNVLREMHEGSCGSHGGYRKMLQKVMRAGYFWPTMRVDAKELIRACRNCQIHGPLIHVPAEELISMAEPCPFARWGIDIVGPLPRATGQRKFLMVAVDYFTKWVEAEPLAKISEKQVLTFLWKNICTRFGVPRELISDNGTQFAGAKVRSWCVEMKIRQKFASVAHPQANGQAEVTNRTILEGLKKRIEQAKGSEK